jgi:hypothetical protein
VHRPERNTPILLLSGICLLWLLTVDGLLLLLLLRVSGLARIRLLRVDGLRLTLLLALAELDVADSGSIVAQAANHEEDKVDDAEDPNDGSEASTTTHDATQFTKVAIYRAVVCSIEGRPRCTPCPTRKPENDAQNVRNQEDDAVVELRCLQFEGDAYTVNDP